MEWDEKKAVKGSETSDGEVKGGEGGDSGQTMVTVVMFPCLPVCPFLWIRCFGQRAILDLQ